MAKAALKAGGGNSHWALFLILPFFAGAKAFQNFRAPWAKNVLWAFVVFSGLTFTIGKESVQKGASSDIVRYVEELKKLYGKSFTFNEAIKYFENSGEADILRTVIAISVSRVTNSQVVLTAVYGFIFGFFFSRNLWFILTRMKGKLKFFSILLFMSFFLLDAFWEINGFRFNTAIHIFIYGMLPYLYDGKRRYLLVACSAIMVHFTFVLPLTILAIYFVLGNRSWLYFILFVLSCFFKEVNLTAFNSFIENNAPESFVDRSSSYRGEDKVAEFRGEKEADVAVVQKNWYAVIYIDSLIKSLIILLIFLFLRSRKNIQNIKGLYNAFCFSLLFFSIANILSTLPSGGRFVSIAAMLSITVIILYYQNISTERYLHNITRIAIPAFLLFIIVAIRAGLYSIGITTIIGNPFLSLLSNYNISVNDLIK